MSDVCMKCNYNLPHFKLVSYNTVVLYSRMTVGGGRGPCKNLLKFIIMNHSWPLSSIGQT